MRESKDIDTIIVIDAFHRKLQAIGSLAVSQLKHAKENQERDHSEVSDKIYKAIKYLEGGKHDVYGIAQSTNTIYECKRRIQSLQSVPHDVVLAEVLFTSIFSSLDAYLNHLLRSLYARSPRLLGQLKEKDVPFGDVLNQTKDEIIASMVDSELDSLLRESYVKIFEKLASRFNVTTLKEFSNWPRFVESTQKRNVIMHCDGHANRQYIDICKAEGVALAPDLLVGDKLTVSGEYLTASIEVVTEVGLMLGQVLLRVSDESAIEEADAHLGNLIFELLKGSEWELALRMGEFGQKLAQKKYRKPRNDRAVKIITINHSQAAKWSGNKAAAFQILDQFDWSGSAQEFRFAVACLKEEWDTAATLMQQIGPDSELCPIHGYVGWPIYREFRVTTQFLDTFRSMFGVEFATEVTKASAEDAALPATTRNKQRKKSHASGPNPKVVKAKQSKRRPR